MWNTPVRSDRASCTDPVSALFAVTTAPGRIACCSSWTVPDSSASTDWPNAEADRIAVAQTAIAHRSARVFEMSMRAADHDRPFRAGWQAARVSRWRGYSISSASSLLHRRAPDLIALGQREQQGIGAVGQLDHG